MMIHKTAKTAVAPGRSLTEREAVALTGRIRKAVDSAWALLLEAQEREAWKALKYASWEAYVRAEFSLSRSRSYQLLDQGRVIAAIAEATGDLSTSVHISEAVARDIKADLSSVTADIKTRVQQGEAPQKAATDVIAEKRAAKEKVKAEHDRQRDRSHAALPDAVKQHVTARHDAVAKAKADGSNVETVDRVSELEELVRGLEADNAALKAENAKFADMWVQYQQGGFEAVIAGKDEEIRTLNARLIQESEDKAGWMKRAKGWQKRATDLGWSGDVVIPLDPQSSDDEVISLG
ncbi:hypothetical protein NKH47_17870 [Mesorhizobium sp. M1060]|uniref:hypothetical protein n=1 Tax=unclassified Mesorhizobium TaxID=325217 RepID=UPI0003CF05B2|nr:MULTISPECIES: hypothetical protein [unclassified Mesorhizobium]ESX32877.1 hypothetical protein X765_03810 [Mesorhizobium sp. LSHC440B00]ESX40053.1 hypothetical protein X763_04610 [Mesorhizobium sp. LSHC432A00]ESX44947.1 hypothetical protein X764_03625 [Mesorhizobium sp. LSHC440A00]WJI59312.1 hypothetical protein NLY33_11625 [Mesorhizobium sp. C432A]